MHKIITVMFFVIYYWSETLCSLQYQIIYSSTIFSSFYNEYPSLTIDKTGKVWIVCTGITSTGEEAIFLTKFDGNTWSQVQQVSEHANQEFNPKIVCDLDNNIWIAWAAKRKDKWDIYVRKYSQYNDQWSEEFNLTDDRVPDFNPVIVVDRKNRVWVAWESLRYNEFSIKVSYYDGSKWSEPLIVSSSGYRNFRPSIAVDKKNNIWISWDGYKENSGYDIFLRCITSDCKVGNIIQVTQHPAYDQAPSLAVDGKNRLWIAFHSNRAETETGYDIIKWTTLLCFDGVNFYEPAIQMKDKDTNKTGEDQGSEFPTIVFDENDILWIFSRASQSFKLQLYNGDTWSEMKDISLPGWGGRGDRVSAVCFKNRIYTVQRDLNTAYFQVFKLKEETQVKKKIASVKIKKYFEKKYFGKSQKQKISYPQVDIYNVYFGDLHIHSSLSDGLGVIEEVYPRSKDIYGWDFAALTDHDWFGGNRILNSEWDYVKLMAKEFYQPGKFVTIPAHEWTTARVTRGGWGHKNIYYYEDDPPMFGVLNEISSTSVKLIEVVRKHGALAIPHHIGWTGVDWNNHDVYAQPVYEIISAHGVYEFFGNLPITHRGGIKGMFAQDGWKKGLIFGVVGGSDSHGMLYHHGISSKRDPYIGGLTAVLCEELTREQVLNALRQRRCYATSGTKIFVDFRVNRFNVMGSQLVEARPPRIYVNVKGTNKIAYVYLLRNNEVIYYAGKDFDLGYGARIEFVDDEIPVGKNYYYVRVVQEDNEIAITSPIWYEYRK